MKDDPLPRMQVADAITPLTPNVSAELGASKLLLAVRTTKVTIGSRQVWTMWNGELFDGAGVLPPGSGGFFDLQAGSLFIDSWSMFAQSPPAQSPSPIPSVVRVGTVQAGSVGTQWLLMRRNAHTPPTSWIILVDPQGRVELTAEKSPHTAFLSYPLHYIELPNHALPAGALQQHIDDYLGNYPGFATEVRDLINQSVLHVP